MITRKHAIKLRQMIVKASASLPDADALESMELFDNWQTDTAYTTGQRLRYDGKLYKVLQDHTSQTDWKPDITPSLYVEVSEPCVIPVWKQPTGAQDAYMKGDKVHYPAEDDPVYISTVDNNVWSPDSYGWDKVVIL